MNIPHIYGLFDLFQGLLMIAASIPLLRGVLLRIRKQPFYGGADNGSYLGIGVWFATSGPFYLSRAFDPPHQESPLTDILFWIAVTGFGIILTLYLVARRLRKSQPEETMTKVEK